MRSDPTLSRVALDLLFIACNLERTGDHTTNIAEDVLFVVKGIDVRAPCTRTRKHVIVCLDSAGVQFRFTFVTPTRIFRDASPRPEAVRTPAEILSIAKMQLTPPISETFSYPHSFTRNSTHTRRGAPGEKNVALCTGALPA